MVDYECKAPSKGQLISEQICGALKFSKNATNALATKMGQKRKIKAHYHENEWIYTIWYNQMTLFSWFDPF